VNVALVVGCAAAGGLVGTVAPVVIERVPAKSELLESPFPESQAWLRTWRGWAVVGVTAGLFAGMAARFGADVELLAFLVLAAGLVVLSVIDLREFLLPNRVVYPLAAVSAALLGLAAVVDDDLDAFARAGIAAAAAFLAFTVLHLLSPRSMGFGDVKLSFVLGLGLGWLGTGEVVLGLALGFVYGAAVGVVLLATRLRSRRDHVPFGPFMAAGALTAVLVGQAILDWYGR